MMISSNHTIAKKYAHALLNLYFNDMKPTCIKSLQKLLEYFRNHQQLMHYLSIPRIPESIKMGVLEKIFDSLAVCNTVQRLLHPLTTQRRIELIDSIVQEILHQYEERSGSIAFIISSSHELNEEDRFDIINFLHEQLNKKIISTFIIDKKLICGFKARSKSIIFERSLQKKIRNAQTSFYERIKP